MVIQKGGCSSNKQIPPGPPFAKGGVRAPQTFVVNDKCKDNPI